MLARLVFSQSRVGVVCRAQSVLSPRVLGPRAVCNATFSSSQYTGNSGSPRSLYAIDSAIAIGPASSPVLRVAPMTGPGTTLALSRARPRASRMLSLGLSRGMASRAGVDTGGHRGSVQVAKGGQTDHDLTNDDDDPHGSDMLSELAARRRQEQERPASSACGGAGGKTSLKTHGFGHLGIPEPIVASLAQEDIKHPTKIQRMAIPEIIRGHSLMLAAQTGTGKTLSYLLPLITRIKQLEEQRGGKRGRAGRPRALIIVPNRELGEQTAEIAKSLSHAGKFRAVGLTGGKKPGQHKRELMTPVDILIGTPGKLLQYLKSQSIGLRDVEHVVIDEADTIFRQNNGFTEELEALLRPIHLRLVRTGFEAQWILVGATFNQKFQKYAQTQFPGMRYMATNNVHKPPARLTQEFLKVTSPDKFDSLLHVMRESNVPSRLPAIVFCSGVPSCRATEHFLQENGFRTCGLHGDIPPKLRRQLFRQFTEGESDILVCTDLAARGLDTKDVRHVINFDFPRTAIDYMHRVGRTARAGTHGHATSLITRADSALASGIQRAVHYGLTLESLARDPVANARLEEEMRLARAAKRAMHLARDPRRRYDPDYQKQVTEQRIDRQRGKGKIATANPVRKARGERMRRAGEKRRRRLLASLPSSAVQNITKRKR
eukprot:TRINITY_DN13087_c0_g1_i1.p1 TRINITY_DN13087_c0_g1~~TRINITY_DN13087_c0_g1_i1.p1  ORF type:complete len:660 (-),score=98.44 TRINITY_DN13087_c0_g1_i1:75-2054(-)